MTHPQDDERKGLSRRRFLAAISGAAAGATAFLTVEEAIADFTYLQVFPLGTDPLSGYPNRTWEQVYRDLYTPDSTYHYLCAPNDTHGCLLKANVKNGVVIYSDPSFKYNGATDLYGNVASARWNPRACISGLSYVRRQYSDRRVKGPMIRKGFKAWVDAGFPRDNETGKPPPEYIQGRGKEDFIQLSWDEAFDIAARASLDIATTFSGEEGARKLEAQGYDPDMIERLEGAGTRTLKFRGGMPYNAPLRLVGSNRTANMLALLDAYVRKVGPEEAKGGRNWDSYTWHTDLPPGHPMVSGQQTLDFDLYTAENANLILLFGMNWIATKMPDGHWLTEARLHGAKVVTIAPEYQSSSCKADEVVMIRPGSDPAFALGLAHVIVKEELYDAAAVKNSTDLPFLVRSDTLKFLRAKDVFPGYANAPLTNQTEVIPDSHAKLPSFAEQSTMYIPAELREAWGDFVVWDSTSGSPKAVTRDQVGDFFAQTGIDPELTGEFEVTLVDGETVTVRPAFDVVKQYLMDSCDPASISKVTWAPVEAIEGLARDIAANKTKTLFTCGMGPNQFFNGDVKDRAIILVAGLTDNVGHFGGTVGSYAGNYRLPLLNGMAGVYAIEDPFAIELDPSQPPHKGKYLLYESAHYYNYDDRPLRVGNKNFTGKTHMPSPTKSMWVANANSILGNAKWAHNVFMNTIPKIDMVVVNEWFWTASCEYADIVFGVDSWFERKVPDIYGAVTNPFLQAWPRGPLARLHDTRDDTQVWAGFGNALAAVTGDSRFRDYWHFINTGQAEVYLNRGMKAGNTTKGLTFAELEASCAEGRPYYSMTRTSPRIIGWEQRQESKPWYNKTGRLEFYRDEDGFIEYGENLPVHREPVDGTPYEPNVIMAKKHPYLRPTPPEKYGLSVDDLDDEVRQVRNVVLTPDEIADSKHPLRVDGFTHVLFTPKYRHACHTIGASTDTDVVIWGPYGDFYRHDKRKPWVAEGYVDINPEDAAELGIEDGDYIRVQGDPADRPFVGWEDASEEDKKVASWLVRARYYPSIVRGIARAWFHFYVATHGSVEGHETNENGLAKNPRTNYQAAYRYGSHQSITRAWLRPTLQLDDFVRKDASGQLIGEGFEADVYCTNGAPRESFVKMEDAEPGGEDGQGEWYPLAQGYRPSNTNEGFAKYLDGEYFGKEQQDA
ncbi:MAG: molybdopterin-dependent oxidoreductase [Acidimicrobiia bacterium]|nr:molybdopterin-dependent oxidoreductase [Acidimicrobiia bacterium]